MRLASSIDPYPQPDACALAVPPWVLDRVRGGTSREFTAEGGLGVTVRGGENHALVSVRVTDVDGGSAADFEQSTLRCYRTLAGVLTSLDTPHPVRFWNFIPNIRKGGAEGRDRYMVFNAGRFQALTEWFGGHRPSSAHVATASGVGHRGRDLVIHVLTARTPGIHVENPRQVPSFEYSSRYGPIPPCFARATIVTGKHGEKMVLIGGTSSVRGEASVHPGDAAAQTCETLTNLRHLLAAVWNPGDSPCPDLDPLRAVRVYYVHEGDLAAIQGELRAVLSPAAQTSIEYSNADLCRPELLVEIEGVAKFP